MKLPASEVFHLSGTHQRRLDSTDNEDEGHNETNHSGQSAQSIGFEEDETRQNVRQINQF